jgi:hypothetical protein
MPPNSEAAAGHSDGPSRRSRHGRHTRTRSRRRRVGAGLGFVLACDLRVVSTRATLATAFSTIGLTCDSGLAYTLPRAVGEARARELILQAEPVTSERPINSVW